MAKHFNPCGGIRDVNGNYSGAWMRQPATPTIASLRQPARYWIVSDAQLKRDLKGRTLKDVYRENRAGRYAVNEKYVPRNNDGGGIGPVCQSWAGDKYVKPTSLRDEYMAECAARGHVPSLASIDSDHPQNCHRDKAPKRETITGEAYAVGGRGAMPYPEAMAEASAIHRQTGVFASIEQVI